MKMGLPGGGSPAAPEGPLPARKRAPAGRESDQKRTSAFTPIVRGWEKLNQLAL